MGPALPAWVVRHTTNISPMPAVTQQLAKERQVQMGVEMSTITDPCQHQGGQRIVDHRFVIHWQQLLADDRGGRNNRLPVPRARIIPFIRSVYSRARISLVARYHAPPSFWIGESLKIPGCHHPHFHKRYWRLVDKTPRP